MTIDDFGPPLFRVHMVTLADIESVSWYIPYDFPIYCIDAVRVLWDSIDLRTGNAEREEEPGAHPIDRAFTHIEIFRCGPRQCRKREPLSCAAVLLAWESSARLWSNELTHIPADNDIQHDQLRQTEKPSLVDLVRPYGLRPIVWDIVKSH